MQRNLDLIRHILLVTEEATLSQLAIADYVTDNFCLEQISYHIELLIDAGYILAIKISTLGSMYPDFIVQRLTNDGHDFLDSIRDDKVFNETKNRLLTVAGSTVLDIVKSVASSILRDRLGI